MSTDDPTLGDIVGKRHASCVNRRLTHFRCDDVKSGDEARIAGAVFKEQDGALAATALPAGIAAVGSIWAANAGDFGDLPLVVPAGFAILWLLLRLGINTSQRTQAVASRVMEHRREDKGGLLECAPEVVPAPGVDPDVAEAIVALSESVSGPVTATGVTPGANEDQGATQQ